MFALCSLHATHSPYPHRLGRIRRPRRRDRGGSACRCAGELARRDNLRSDHDHARPTRRLGRSPRRRRAHPAAARAAPACVPARPTRACTAPPRPARADDGFLLGNAKLRAAPPIVSRPRRPRPRRSEREREPAPDRTCTLCRNAPRPPGRGSRMPRRHRAGGSLEDQSARAASAGRPHPSAPISAAHSPRPASRLFLAAHAAEPCRSRPHTPPTM